MQNPFVTDHEVQVGVALKLAPGLRVVTAPNPGPMTFTGTQTYLLGVDRVAIIDPGPDDDAHLEALLNATTYACVTHIIVTHAHVDHSPLARRLSRRLDVPVYGFTEPAPAKGHDRRLDVIPRNMKGGEGIDHGHRVDVGLRDGSVVKGDEWELEALHTPGHLFDHLCLAWRNSGIVFTGDHIMSWATTMVSPPDGDMRSFMDSLERMAKRQGDRTYFPGHGGPVEDPGAMIDWQIRHRLARENQILDSLSERRFTPNELVQQIYTNIDRRLIPAAERNVLAHLIDLSDRGLVEPKFRENPLGPYTFTGT
ncbi:MAG: MBL fold metallo-hydrolase [Rhodobacteraceae bacterium]|nr:MBL fold metallo-hydrolase [Paracoccaceae bacterium]MCY4138965.1 MBL fold metallo-hydrolase [Paracoccaceae bacterium]